MKFQHSANIQKKKKMDTVGFEPTTSCMQQFNYFDPQYAKHVHYPCAKSPFLYMVYPLSREPRWREKRVGEKVREEKLKDKVSHPVLLISCMGSVILLCKKMSCHQVLLAMSKKKTMKSWTLWDLNPQPHACRWWLMFLQSMCTTPVPRAHSNYLGLGEL